MTDSFHHQAERQHSRKIHMEALETAECFVVVVETISEKSLIAFIVLTEQCRWCSIIIAGRRRRCRLKMCTENCILNILRALLRRERALTRDII